MIVAAFLAADAVVVPISCNDAIDRGPLAHLLEAKTRIGSPYVIAGMEAARARGKQKVCGWEANGGFLTGSDFVREDKKISALPTRDALLPILAALVAAREQHSTLCALLDALPERYGRSALLKNFPRATALRIVRMSSPEDSRLLTVRFAQDSVHAMDAANQALTLTAGAAARLLELRARLTAFFPAGRGFAQIAALNTTDGVRIQFTNGDVAHVRPSGNADELRIYAFADTQTRAAEIAAYGIEEPGGLLRLLEKSAG
jgi:phosphomannomutase